MTTFHYKNNNHIKGDYNQVIQIILNNGEKIEETLGNLVARLTQGDKAHIQSLQQQIKLQEASLKDKEEIKQLLDEKLLDLRSQLAQAKKDLEASEERFAQEFLKNDGQDFSGSRELYALAVSAMTAGDSQKALAILDRQQLLEKKKKREQEQEQDAEEWLLRATLLQEANNWGQELDECYEMAVEIWPSWGNCLEAGNHFYTINALKKAPYYYQLSLEKASSLKERAATLNKLALLQDKLIDFTLASENYSEALNIRRKLATDNPEAFLPDVANTLNKLANLQYKFDQNKIALKNYNEALRIRRKLALDNPNTFLPEVANTLNNLANLQCQNKNYQIALNNYREVLDIYQQLALNNSEAFLPYIAITLNNLANLQDWLSQDHTALDNYKKALDIRRELALDNPNTYLPAVATTLSNLASLQYKIKHNQQALDNFLEALKIRQELASKVPAAFELDLADTFFNLSLLYKDNLLNQQQAKAYAQEALALYQKYEAQVPAAKEWGDRAKAIIAHPNPPTQK